LSDDVFEPDSDVEESDDDDEDEDDDDEEVGSINTTVESPEMARRSDASASTTATAESTLLSARVSGD
jgi:hypothetical protein